MSLLLSADELATSIRSGKKTTILACIWKPQEGLADATFRGGHIPTALLCDPAAHLTSAPSSKKGRNPLPSSQLLAASFRRWGLRDDHQVIVYDEDKGIMAARAWWILTWAGVPNVQIVDGGIKAWERGDYEQVGGPGNVARPGTLEPNPGQLPVVTMDEMKSLPDDVLVIDAREKNRYIGKKERLDLKAGHIPGAVNLPLEELMHDDFTYKSEGELREQFAKVGVDDSAKVVVYSGSGLHSAALIAAMHHVGLPGAAHYIGGWSQWCASGSNPVEIGES